MSDAILSPDSFHTTLNNCIKNNGASLHTEQKKKKASICHVKNGCSAQKQAQSCFRFIKKKDYF